MRKNLVALIVLSFILALAFPLATRFFNNEEAFSPYNLIRIHIVANSDSLEDQRIKYEVKDCIVKLLTPELAGIKDVEAGKAVITTKLETIKKETRQELKNHNCTYDVKVALGEFQFPTKSYGDLTLPQGKYQALKIVLGEGQGKNWWCVLFPPLCFQEGRDSTLIYQGEKPPIFLKEKVIRSLNHPAFNL